MKGRSNLKPPLHEDGSRLITVKELADIVGLSEQRIRARVQEKPIGQRIPSVLIGGRRFFNKSEALATIYGVAPASLFDEPEPWKNEPDMSFI